MYLVNKEVLVVGLGVSGLSTVKALHNMGAKISIIDSKTEESLKEVLGEISHIDFKKYLGVEDIDLKNIDLIIKSPGIPPSLKLIQKAIESNIEVITDVELGYRVTKTRNIIGITGTNGKTTVTTLMGEILKKANKNTYVVGNIGVGILDRALASKEEDIFVVELSSFQLEHTKVFKPKISLILNISPDHIDWHGSYEKYIESKMKIYRNQSREDYIVLNYDDKILRSIKGNTLANIIWFSVKEKIHKGIYLDGDNIVIDDGSKSRNFINTKELKVIGKHNIENILGCIGISIAMGLDLNNVREVLLDFKGMEHRLEYVDTIQGISFYNDSKGTNISASISAIKAVEYPIILIAGGSNKGSNFKEFIQAFDDKVKALILLGETKDILKNEALSNGFNDIHLVENMKEAVALSYKIGKENDNVLLSPACASWDMYKSYQERGRYFKEAVFDLEGDINEEQES